MGKYIGFVGCSLFVAMVMVLVSFATVPLLGVYWGHFVACALTVAGLLTSADLAGIAEDE